MVNQNEEIEARIVALEEKVDKLEKQMKKSRKVRKIREYTEEQRAAIRARLLEGQQAALKKRENEAKPAKKVKTGNAEKGKPNEPEKPVVI